MFYIIKLTFTLGIFCIILTNIIRNIDYYSYCKLSEYKEDLFIKNENSNEFRNLCKETFKDFSDHIFLKYSFNLVYKIIKPEHIFEQMTEEEANLIIERIEHTYLGNLKTNMKFFKLTNFIFYVVILYLIFMILPEFFTSILIFIINKCLFVLFLFFVAEGFLNFYTNIRINTVNWISTFINYVPITMINNILSIAWNIIINIRNQMKI